jgi:hypothetical protein
VRALERESSRVHRATSSGLPDGRFILEVDVRRATGGILNAAATFWRRGAGWRHRSYNSAKRPSKVASATKSGGQDA